MRRVALRSRPGYINSEVDAAGLAPTEALIGLPPPAPVAAALALIERRLEERCMCSALEARFAAAEAEIKCAESEALTEPCP